VANDSTAPPPSDYEHRLLGFFKEGIEEGDAFLRSQVGYNRIPESINGIMGQNQDLRVSNLSGVTSNHIGKIALDLVSGMTDVKPFFEFKTYNKRNEAHTSIYGKCSQHIWLQGMLDMKFADTVKYSLAAGSGWAEIYFNEETQMIDMQAWDPRDVIPIRPSTSLSIQDAYGVIARKSRTVNYVRYLCNEVYDCPQQASKIVPDRDGSMVSLSLRNTRVGQLLDKLGNPFRERLFGNRPHQDIPRVPTCDLFTAYVKDETVNEKKFDVEMGQFKDGQPRNNWSYTVKPGDKLYPGKRMVVFTSTAILYDGPSIYWHGLFPFCKLTLDPWPWSWLGKAVLWDLLPLQKSVDKHLRVYDDWLEKLARPDVIADKNSVSKAALDRMDTRRAGGKYQHNPIAGKGMQIVPPPPLPPEFFKGLEFYLNEMNTLSGVADISQMMKLNQIPSSDSIEQIMESMSPSVRLRSRVIEAFMREFATMMAYNISQFMTLSQRLTIMGTDGVTQEDFDYDPATLIPAFVHADDFNSDGTITTAALARGPLPRYDRAREFLRQFSFQIAPGSLLAASEIQRKMMYLQLSRGGLIDHWTLLDVLGIPNVGNPPAGADNITDRLMQEQQMGLGMQVNPAGRKASGQETPRLVTKES
jgi:hypothetical protein